MRISTITAVSCSHSSVNGALVRPSSSSFGPWLARLAVASAALSPPGALPSLARTSALASWCHGWGWPSTGMVDAPALVPIGTR